MAKKQKAADGGLSQSVTHLLHRVLQLALDFHAEAAGPTGLTQRQYTVLAAAGVADGVSQSDLVRATGIDLIHLGRPCRADDHQGPLGARTLGH